MSQHGSAPAGTVSLTIDGIPVTVPEGTSILAAAREIGVDIPTLCDHPDLAVRAACRMCVVECDGREKLKAACANEVWEGVSVVTDNPRIREVRRTVLELILANHPRDCLSCIRNQTCELQALANQFCILEPGFAGEPRPLPRAPDASILVRDMAKCVKCGRCVAVCQEVQTVRAIDTARRGVDFAITTAYARPLSDTRCVYCGQCAAVCPVGAIYENDRTEEVFAAIADPDCHVVVQTAPSVRVTIGDEFGLPAGSVTTGKLVTALRRLGFDRVFGTDFAADVTIIEEGHELLHRLRNGGTLPLITSCSPGWVNFVETFYPDLLPHLSTCKSPQQMFGALVKTYYPRVSGVDPARVVSVSVMPCTAKKFESERPEMRASGHRDVDHVLTTRELARMIRIAGLDFQSLPETSFDPVMGDSTGAGAIFGTSGGVMEAALRTVCEVAAGDAIPAMEFEEVRGHAGLKTASLPLDGGEMKVMVVNGLGNARRVLDSIRRGECDATFIEVMCCPGGCVGGGGQPYATARMKLKRMDGLYDLDGAAPVRQSHRNPEVRALYETFLGKPLGENVHRLLHTTYGRNDPLPE